MALFLNGIIQGGDGGAPDPHKVTHELAGSDEINVVGLSGLLADGQTPLAHNHNASAINAGILAAARLPAATELAQGAGEIGTQVEVDAGLDDFRWVTSLKLASQDFLAKLAGAVFSGLVDFSGTGHGGIRLIRLTTTQRDALTPVTGLMIFNTTTGTVEGYDGAWVDALDGSSAHAFGGAQHTIDTKANVDALLSDAQVFPGTVRAGATGNDTIADDTSAVVDTFTVASGDVVIGGISITNNETYRIINHNTNNTPNSREARWCVEKTATEDQYEFRIRHVQPSSLSRNFDWWYVVVGG